MIVKLKNYAGSLKCLRLIKSIFSVTLKCLYNEASVFCFHFCLSDKVDVACLFVGSGIEIVV